MTSWDPAQYDRYAGERLRPALDLIARIPIAPRSIWDLGCGTGSITALLAKRWPEATVGGLDSSPTMLGRAREIPGIEWRLADIASWEPEQPPELIFSNAALHWLDDHATLLPRLAAQVAPGGVLAVQMPRNFDEPSHALLAATAASSRWREAVGHLVRPAPVAEPAEYHHLLSGRFATLDIWETVYFQVLEGEDPVAEWARGTAARPYLDALDGHGEEFMEDYASRLRRAYPRSDDGTTLFPFRRLFLIGVGPIG
ncbi:MAG: methyltransferase domain-containing protein [Acidimicrobiia bacterium]